VAIDYRVRSGALVVVRRGVYALGHGAPRPQARPLAAVLGSGPDAALSHAAAAAHWEVRSSAATLIDVTVPRRIRGQRGIRHTSPSSLRTRSRSTTASRSRPSRGRSWTSPAWCPSPPCGAPWRRPRARVLRREGLPLPATNAWVEGFEVDRVTWRQIHDEPFALLADLSGLLVRARAG
jgi:hypothetical protein